MKQNDIRKVKEAVMVECKTCKKEISKRAKSCPYCGELSSASRLMRFSLGLICLGVAIIIGLPIIIIIVMAIAG